MGKHNIDQRSHINKKNNTSKNNNESCFEQMGNATFQITKCFFKKCEYAILQQYAIGQKTQAFFKN